MYTSTKNLCTYAPKYAEVMRNTSEKFDKFQRFNDALNLYPPISYQDIYLHNKTSDENDIRIIELVQSKSFVYFNTKNAIKECSKRV